VILRFLRGLSAAFTLKSSLGQVLGACFADLSLLGLGASGACLARAKEAVFVIGWVRAMAVLAPWRTVMRGFGGAVVSVALLNMLSRTAKTATGVTGAGPGIVPFPATIALYNPCPSRQGLGVGDHAKQGETYREFCLTSLWEVDKPACGDGVGFSSAGSGLSNCYWGKARSLSNL
jgi:hypothetical protein